MTLQSLQGMTHDVPLVLPVRPQWDKCHHLLEEEEEEKEEEGEEEEEGKV